MSARIAAAALLLGLASPQGIASGATAIDPRGLAANASVAFHIKIPRILRMRLLGHPSTIVLGEGDVAKGEIVVQGGRLDVRANGRDGYVLRAELAGANFEQVVISGLEAPITAKADEGYAARLPSAHRETAELEYRLRLRRGISPGRYAWPVSLTVQEP